MRKRDLSRRELLLGAAATGVGAVVGTGGVAAGAAAEGTGPQGATMRGVPFERRRSPRFSVIGVGGRGTGLLANLLGCEGIVVPAVCNIDAGLAQRAGERIKKAGQAAPTLYTAGERAYENLCSRDEPGFCGRGNAVKLACSDGSVCDDSRETRRTGSPRGDDSRGLLEAGGHL